MASLAADATLAPDIANVGIVAPQTSAPDTVTQTLALKSGASGPSVSALSLLGFLLALVGGIALALVWFARRINRDSLLR